jgi:hypothetical protein
MIWFLSGVGGVPTPTFWHWLGANSKCMLKYMGLCRILCNTHVRRLKFIPTFSLKLIISFLVYKTQFFITLSNIHSFSGQSWHASSSLIVLYLLFGAERATKEGLKFCLQQSGNADIQEHYYNGWTHDYYVTSVFCFCPDGTIPIAFFNVTGSVHESQVADLGNIHGKLVVRGKVFR